TSASTAPTTTSSCWSIQTETASASSRSRTHDDRPRHGHVRDGQVVGPGRARATGPPSGRHRRRRLDRGGLRDRRHGTAVAETAIEALLDDHAGGSLFVSGCVANQGRFYARFDAVVLLSAPA